VIGPALSYRHYIRILVGIQLGGMFATTRLPSVETTLFASSTSSGMITSIARMTWFIERNLVRKPHGRRVTTVSTVAVAGHGTTTSTFRQAVEAKLASCLSYSTHYEMRGYFRKITTAFVFRWCFRSLRLPLVSKSIYVLFEPGKEVCHRNFNIY
jgi:hypothetical protein